MGTRVMWTRQHKQRNTGRLIVPTLCAAVLAYFGFHAYHGEFGIYSRYRMQAQVADLQAQVAAIKGQRIELERRVQLLHDGTLENVRTHFGLVATADEVEQTWRELAKPARAAVRAL